MKPVILDLCGGKGAWSHFYKLAGYDVRLVTLPDNDVRFYTPPPNVHGILAAPPCTDFSFALNEKIERNITGGLEIVGACQRIVSICEKRGLKWWAMENPVGHLQRHIGPPRFIFQPWEFGDPWTKRTAIWGEFTAPKPIHSSWDTVEKNTKLYVRPGRKKPNMIWLHKSAKDSIPAFAPFSCASDADFRSLTPQGFAKSFFEVNP